MQKEDVRAPAVQIMSMLREQLESSGTVLLKDVWNSCSSLGSGELRDGVRMLIESDQLAMQAGPSGPQLRLP